MIKNLNLYPKDDEQRKQWIDEYQNYLGYYVTSKGEKLIIHCLPKPKTKPIDNRPPRGYNKKRYEEDE